MEREAIMVICNERFCKHHELSALLGEQNKLQLSFRDFLSFFFLHLENVSKLSQVPKVYRSV